MLDAEVSPGFRIEQYAAPDTIPADTICRVLRIPNHIQIIAAVSDVLAFLSRPFTWEAASEEQEIQMRAVMAQMIVTYFDGDCDEPMIGELRLFVVSILPSNVLPCDGSTYNQGDYPTLAAVLPASLKDDVAGTFTTPDFTGRFPVGSGDGFAIGETGGEAEHILNISELPSHTHMYTVGTSTAGSGPRVPVKVNVAATEDFETGAIGDDQPHNNMPPYFALKIGIVAR